MIRQWVEAGALADPAMVGFIFEPASIDMSRSIVSRVVRGGSANRYFILHFGPRLFDATGVDARGHYLDEILQPRSRDHTLAQYDLAVRTGKPVYSIASTCDEHGVPVDYERLLLPFSSPAGEVNCILATSLLISSEGRFELEGIFSHGEFPSSSQSVVYLIEAHQPEKPAPSHVVQAARQ